MVWAYNGKTILVAGDVPSCSLIHYRAGTLLGCVAMALVPLPIIFYIKGHKIRERSTYAPTHGPATQAATHHSDEDLSKPRSGVANNNADVEKQK